MTETQPTVYFFGLRVDEPFTAFTNLIIAGVCLYAFLRLGKIKAMGRTHLFFRWYFLLMSLAMVLSGVIGHAFLFAFPFNWRLLGWLVSSVAVFLLERSAIEYARPLSKPWVIQLFLWLHVIKLIAIVAAILLTREFVWVQLHSGLGLLVLVVPLHFCSFRRTNDRGSLLVLFGIGVAALASIVFHYKISMHTWFNHLDISHLFIAISCYIFYKGALLMDRT